MRVGSYEVIGRLGSGATGTVYLAERADLDLRVAIKELRAELRADPDFLERFRAEAKVMARLQHPHCVRVFDLIETYDHAYLITEYVDGPSLRQLFTERGRLSPEQSVGVLRGALLGLGHAHDLGLVHRDVKPSNILCDRAGTSKLIDFGEVVDAGTMQRLGGTPAYMSPELVRGAIVDRRADIYSVGAVLYEALEGRPPFSADDPTVMMRMHLDTEVPAPARMPPPLARVVLAALSKDPSARPPDVPEMVGALEEGAVASYGADWEQRAVLALGATALGAGAGALAAGAGGGGAAAGGTASVGTTQVTASAASAPPPVHPAATPAAPAGPPAAPAHAAGPPPSAHPVTPPAHPVGPPAAHPPAAASAHPAAAAPGPSPPSPPPHAWTPPHPAAATPRPHPVRRTALRSTPVRIARAGAALVLLAGGIVAAKTGDNTGQTAVLPNLVRFDASGTASPSTAAAIPPSCAATDLAFTFTAQGGSSTGIAGQLLSIQITGTPSDEPLIGRLATSSVDISGAARFQFSGVAVPAGGGRWTARAVRLDAVPLEAGGSQAVTVGATCPVRSP